MDRAVQAFPNSSGHQTPLSAAMELLKYGLIFHYCKDNRTILYPDTTVARPVLEAKTVHLESWQLQIVIGARNAANRSTLLD